jgi:hypothetical protein
MTTTVRVQARAWGAKVETNGETIEMGAHQERTFHIDEGQSQSFTVTHGEAPVDRAAQMQDEEVPGRAQNDELLGQGGAGTNETGATETASARSSRRAGSTTAPATPSE